MLGFFVVTLFYVVMSAMCYLTFYHAIDSYKHYKKTKRELFLIFMVFFLVLGIAPLVLMATPIFILLGGM